MERLRGRGRSEDAARAGALRGPAPGARDAPPYAAGEGGIFRRAVALRGVGGSAESALLPRAAERRTARCDARPVWVGPPVAIPSSLP